jgi:hypothetical protein
MQDANFRACDTCEVRRKPLVRSRCRSAPVQTGRARQRVGLIAGFMRKLRPGRGQGMTRAFSCGADRMAAPANDATPRIAATAKTSEHLARRGFEL